MNLVITIIAVLMVADACFTLLNLSKVESILRSVFPRMNVKKLALVEGMAGIAIIVLKVGTDTVS
jgi:hypothetical protein